MYRPILLMAKRYFSYKIIFFLLLLVLLGRQGLLAQAPPPVEEDVTINARVGEEVEIIPSGGSFGFFATGVRFTGEAYPNARVVLLKKGQEVLETRADTRGLFSASLPEDYDANILYSLFAEDLHGEQSLLINYPLVVRMGYISHLSGIRFPPTVTTDKVEAKHGSFVTVSGYALPNKTMLVTLEGSGGNKDFSFESPHGGAYKIVVPLAGLSKGEYVVSVKYRGDARVSKLIKFIIGELNIFQPDTLLNIPGDCNSDKIINLVDFSVLAFWYGKNNPPRCVDTNGDGKINLVDFSILAFYWTG